MPSLYGITTMPRLRSRQMFVLVLVVTSLFALGGVSSGQSAAELRAQMKAAIVAAEAALVSEEARLDELAKYNVNRTLADGRPSVAQTASNIRLWGQRIREFEAGERELREALNSTLASLDSDIRQLAQRLSAQREQVEQQTTAQQRAEREQAEQRETDRQAREQAGKQKAGQERVERERAEQEEAERKAREQVERQNAEQERIGRERAEQEEAERNTREQAARAPVSLQWLTFRSDIPRDAVIGGRYNAEPAHVCRDVLHDGIYVGILYSGSHSGSCYIGWRGGHRRGPDFEVLTGIGEIKWIDADENFVDPGLLTADSVVIYGDGGFSVKTTGGLDDQQPDPNAWYVFRGGQQANGIPIFICNADHDSGPKPGGVVDGNCHFEYSGEQIKNEFRLLVVKGWAETLQDSLARRDESLASMAVRQLEAGNLEHALDAATRMNLAERKDQLLNQLVLAQLQGDNLHDALGTAKLISVAQLRDEMLNQVAMAQFRTGNLQEAIATAILMKVDQHRDDMFGRVVDKYREAWKLQEALSTAAQIDNDNSRRKHLYNIAAAQVEAGDYEGAMGTAQLSHAPGNDYRDKAFGRVVDKYREAWKLQEALSTAAQIDNDNSRRKHLYNIAAAQVEAGDYEGAMGTAQLSHAPGNDYRDKAFGRVVDKYREAWKLQEALSVAEQIYHDNSRRKHLYNIAVAQVEAGDYEGAMGTAQLSHAPGNDYRDKVLGRVVDKYREAGKFQEALGIAEQIYHDGWRRQHLHNIARGQVDAGDQGGAKATANRIEDPQLRDKVLSEIAKRSR